MYYFHFLVTVHTKNVHHSSFGNIKRRLKTKEVLTPTKMILVVEEISVSTNFISGSQFG